MKLMKTAEEMMTFIKEKDTGSGLGKSKCLEYLKLIEGDLAHEEYAMMAFAATHTTCYLEGEGDFVGVLTNSRILMAKQGRTAIFKRIPLTEFNGMAVSLGKTFGSIIIDTSKTQIFMENTVPRVMAIQKLFEEALGSVDGVDVETNCRAVQFPLPKGAPKLAAAEEMLHFCEANGTLSGMKRDKALECFRIIEGCLENEEHVRFAFIALQYNMKEKVFAVAVSNKRILMARQELMYGRILRFATFGELEEVSVLSGSDTARIKIQSTKIEMDMEVSGAATGKFMEEMFASILAEPGVKEKQRGIRESGGNFSKEVKDGGLGDVKMRTAEEMLQYCISQGTLNEKRPKQRLKDFEMLKDCLEKDEYVITCFVGEYSETSFKALNAGGYVSVVNGNEKWACAFSNKRMIMTQKHTPPARLRSIPYKRLNDVFVGISEPFANVVISTSNCDLDIRLDSGGEFLQQQLNEIQRKILESKKKLTAKDSEISNYSIADEIRKFKELCDDGIITEEEFQKKKSELLAENHLFVELGGWEEDIIIENS